MNPYTVIVNAPDGEVMNYHTRAANPKEAEVRAIEMVADDFGCPLKGAQEETQILYVFEGHLISVGDR